MNFGSSTGPDWWIQNYLTGSIKAVKYIAAAVTMLGFNPNLIIYFPVGNDKISKGWAGNPDNGKYDIVFKTNRVPLKPKEWKAIRSKLKKAKWSRYKFKYDPVRVKEYFTRKTKPVREVPSSKILKKAGAEARLACGTAFFTYPRLYYMSEAVVIWDWIKESLAQKMIGVYNEERDSYMCDKPYCFCWGGYHKAKYTNERPGCTMNVEIYDMNIVNRYLKDKDILVENAKVREVKNRIEGYNQFTYASTNILKIKA